jgi:hypothetical protein
MNGFFVLQSMLPKSMSSDLIRGWDHARMKSGCMRFGQQHAQLLEIGHVMRLARFEAKRVVI